MREVTKTIFSFTLLVATVSASVPTMAASIDISDSPLSAAAGVAPNIMFIVDTSGSMQAIVPEDSPYNPNTTPFDCPSSRYVAVNPSSDNITREEQIIFIAIPNSGPMRIKYQNQHYMFGNTGGAKCFNPNATYHVVLAARPGNPYAVGSIADAYMPYTGRFLNWYFDRNTTNPAWTSGLQKPQTFTRMQIAKNALNQVIDTFATENIRVGLAGYNSEYPTIGTGGELHVAIADIKNNVSTIKQKINALVPSGTTPLASTMSDVGRYFATGYTGSLTLHPGKTNQSTASVNSVFSSQLDNNTGNALANPIQNYCQKSFAVLMTDGDPSHDATNVSSHIKDYTGECPNGPDCLKPYNLGRKKNRTYLNGGSDYLDDVTMALFEIDLRPDLKGPNNTKTEPNNVRTHVIGFADATVEDAPLLRHAAIRGGGTWFYASHSTSLVSAFKDIMDDVSSGNGSVAAIGVSNPFITASDNFAYLSSFNTGSWSGNLEAFRIVSAGVIDKTKRQWEAQSQLTAKTPSERRIVTYDKTARRGVQFQASGASGPGISSTLTAALQNVLNTNGKTDSENVVAYLRGDRSKEGTDYRTRTSLLGDIVHAEPVVRRVPEQSFSYPGYTKFKDDFASRARVIYQAANDGMLHVFDAANGKEVWAYIPSHLFPSLNNLTLKADFKHKYYVDATPTIADADTSNNGSGWRTILAGGLGKGGRGYYALDVTSDPSSEAQAASKVLWEFPDSSTSATDVSNVGYSFGQPVIVKTQNEGWVVLVTSGYNNGTDTGGDGKGYLYVLRAGTGELIKAIGTGIGSDTDPSGLAHISAYVERGKIDRTTDYVYGGDLKGNVWRFNLTGPSSGWSVARLVTLVDSSGTPQPITTAPELSKDSLTKRRFVFVGTGRYLANSDIPGTIGATAQATQTQTMYGIWDDLKTPVDDSNHKLRDRLKQQVFTASGAIRTAATAKNNPVDYGVYRGWFIDLPLSGERVDTDPQLGFGTLVFTSNIPKAGSEACEGAGGSSWLNALDMINGTMVVPKSGSITAAASRYLGDSLSSKPVLIQTPGTTKGHAGYGVNSGGIVQIGEIPGVAGSAGARRVTWKEINIQ